jgi:hypothetical protein
MSQWTRLVVQSRPWLRQKKWVYPHTPKPGAIHAPFEPRVIVRKKAALEHSKRDDGVKVDSEIAQPEGGPADRNAASKGPLI